jgi:integrase/recombinase XerD
MSIEMNFESYLQEHKKYSQSTSKSYQKYVSYFVLYLENEGIRIQNLSYKDLISFMTYRQKQGYKKEYINTQLSAVKHYLSFLVEKAILPYNVGSGLFIRGRHKTVPTGLLSGEELAALYENYQVKTDTKQHYVCRLRHKVLIGLMVFEGLLADEMQHLKVSDLELQKATIVVASSGRSENRILALQSIQLYDIIQYLTESKVNEFLFVGNVRNMVFNLFKHLRRINPLATCGMQLKMSLLTHLLKSKDLREVQYFAGHSFVSSTERYQTSQLDALQNDLCKFHPLK